MASTITILDIFSKPKRVPVRVMRRITTPSGFRLFVHMGTDSLRLVSEDATGLAVNHELPHESMREQIHRAIAQCEADPHYTRQRIDRVVANMRRLGARP